MWYSVGRKVGSTHNLHLSTQPKGTSLLVTGADQADKVVGFGHEFRAFESSHHQSTYPPGSALLTEAPYLKMMCNVPSLKEGNKKDKIVTQTQQL